VAPYWRIGMIKRNFTDRSPDTIMALYKIAALIVTPHLEYCCQIWNPHFSKESIEGVQRRATKLVQGIGQLHYDDRLKHLGLIRLESDLIETYKIINNVYTVPR